MSNTFPFHQTARQAARQKASRRILGRTAFLIAVSMAALLLFGPANAQDETTVVKIEAPTEPVTVGEEFEVRILVDDVSGLAAFDFSIAYDQSLLSYQRITDLGDLLNSGERQEIFCGDPVTQPGLVSVSCVTIDAPICLGGLPGSSGSGLLGTVVFRVEAGGQANLNLVTPTNLVLDDVEPCDPADGQTQVIPHSVEGASVELTPLDNTPAPDGDDDFPWTIVGLVAGVVVVLLALGGAALIYQGRGNSDTP